ncbi:diguanylate cyclase [Dokdonella soli]|uniref:diguanylate cyclase n=1 Tax=Dokdonella soli TaxID=529810 RepID=A0ABN1IBA6_9GAMM
MGLVLSWASICASAYAAETTYPRAQAAAAALRTAMAVEESLSSAANRLLVRGIAGPRGEARLAWIAANAFSAVGAITAADREWKRAAELAQRDGDTSTYGTALAQQANIALARGDYARCADLAEALETLARASGDSNYEAIAQGNLGVIARRHGHLDAALAHQQRALDLHRANHDTAGITLALTDLSTVHRDRGSLAQALDTALEAEALREKTGNHVEIAYRNIALLYREIEDTTAARSYFRRALDTAAGNANPLAYAPVVGAYANLLNDVGEYAAAQAAASEALAIDEALGDRPHQGLEHLEIGRALLGQHQVDAAVAELETALRLGRELDQREIVARALLHLADAALLRHDYLRAHGLLDEAIAGLEAAQLRPQLAQAYASREQLAHAEHDDAGALRFAHKYTTAREELLGIRTSRQLAALEVRHQHEQAKQRIVLLAKDNELKAALLEKQRLLRHAYFVSLVGLCLLLALVGWRFASVSRHNRILASWNGEIESQRAALRDANQLLERQALDLHRAAITDSMTGVANRGHALEQLASRIEECVRDGRELSVLLIDFDHFKQINDLYGHLFGDGVLIAGVEAMRECLHPDDLIGRIGGEEFIVVVAGRGADEVDALAERLRARVAEELAKREPQLLGTATVSIGVAGLEQLESAPGAEALLEAADRALYAAKRDGRDRVRRSGT